jgi:hypothetical protein
MGLSIANCGLDGARRLGLPRKRRRAQRPARVSSTESRPTSGVGALAARFVAVPAVVFDGLCAFVGDVLGHGCQEVGVAAALCRRARWPRRAPRRQSGVATFPPLHASLTGHDLLEPHHLVAYHGN